MRTNHPKPKTPEDLPQGWERVCVPFHRPDPLHKSAMARIEAYLLVPYAQIRPDKWRAIMYCWHMDHDGYIRIQGNPDVYRELIQEYGALLDRPDGPALIETYKHDNSSIQTWYSKGLRTRRLVVRTDKTSSELFYSNGELDGKPASIWRDAAGVVVREADYEKGLMVGPERRYPSATEDQSGKSKFVGILGLLGKNKNAPKP